MGDLRPSCQQSSYSTAEVAAIMSAVITADADSAPNSSRGGKGILGKGILGKGILGKGILGKGILGKGILGKGIGFPFLFRCPTFPCQSFSRSRGFSTMRQRQGLAEAERRWEPQIWLMGRSRQVSVSFWWTEKWMTEKWEQPLVPKMPFFCHQFFCPVSDPWIPDRLPHGLFLSQAGRCGQPQTAGRSKDASGGRCDSGQVVSKQAPSGTGHAGQRSYQRPRVWRRTPMLTEPPPTKLPFRNGPTGASVQHFVRWFTAGFRPYI
jgi:hypothetical protein